MHPSVAAVRQFYGLQGLSKRDRQLFSTRGRQLRRHVSNERHLEGVVIGQLLRTGLFLCATRVTLLTMNQNVKVKT